MPIRIGLKRQAPLLWGLTLLLLLADRITKSLILNGTLAPREIIRGIFSIVHVTNTGIAFGFLSRISPSIMNPLLMGVGVLVCIALFYFLLFDEETKGVRLAMHLLLAGAIGNIWDRIQWGKVVDFLDFHVNAHHWPAFNIADASISMGLILMVLLTLFSKKHASDPD